MSTETTDRVTKISLGKYDQVIAVTQYMINSGLSNLFLAHSDDDEMLEAFEIDQGQWSGGLTGVSLDTPVIQVLWSPSVQNQLLYMLKFKAGNMKVCTNKKTKMTPKPQYQEFDLAGWQLGVPVVLTFDQLAKDDPVYQEKVATQPPGQYSVTRLLVSASAGTTAIDLEKSVVPGIDWKKTWDSSIRTKITNMMNALLEVLFEYTLNTIGYAVTSTDVQLLKKEHPPTFQPTDLRLQTYPWQAPGGGFKDAESNDITKTRLNYLCYLEMTNNHPPPDATNATLNYSGNWSDGKLEAGSNPSAMDFGNFAMSRQTFLEAYLIPKLRRINKAMEPRVSNLSNKLWWETQPFIFNYSWNCDCRVGYNNDHLGVDDPYFDFKLAPGSRDTYVFKSVYNSDQPGMADMWDKQDLGWGVATWGQIGCECENTLKFTPGSPDIVINGRSHVKLYYSGQNMVTWDDTLDFTVNWSMTLTLQSVSDGGLQIAVKAVQPTITKSYTLDYGILTSYCSYLETCYSGALENLTHLQNELAQDISGQQKFYFPASGTFFFKDPKMNWDGALIAAIGYRGADDFRNPQETRERYNVIPKPDGAQPEQPGNHVGSGETKQQVDK